MIVEKIKSKNKKKNSFVDSGDKIVIEKEQKYTVIVLKNETLHENEKDRNILKNSQEKYFFVKKLFINFKLMII